VATLLLALLCFCLLVGSQGSQQQLLAAVGRRRRIACNSVARENFELFGSLLCLEYCQPMTPTRVQYEGAREYYLQEVSTL